MPDTLPSSLTKVPQVDRNFNQPGTWFIAYCANCTKEVARIRDTELPAQYAFALCNECVEKHGEPAGVTRTPDDLWMDKVRGAMQEEYGHVLTNFEVLKELEDSTSIISKLESEGQRRK